MLGSLTDADDALQETQLRAWHGLGGFQGRAPLRHWLYRITTTSCLKLIRARGRVPLPAGDLFYLQPYRDWLLDQLTAGDLDPAMSAEQRDSVALAFIAAMQRLPATQRAALVLRDVLGYRPAETAQLLDTSVAAANSLLQRARATLRTHHDSAFRPRPLDATEQQIVRRFVQAWQRRDIPVWRRCWPRTRSCGCRRSGPNSPAETGSPTSPPPRPPAQSAAASPEGGNPQHHPEQGNPAPRSDTRRHPITPQGTNRAHRVTQPAAATSEESRSTPRSGTTGTSEPQSSAH